MAFTTDNNFELLPTGAVDWVAAYNALANKVEAGRTVYKIAAATITQWQCFYINSSGEAAIASATTDVVGIWQTSSTALGVAGYGQISGTMTNGGWAWTPGTYLYSGASGALTATPSTTGRRIAYALTATKIMLLSNFMSTYTASRALVTDASGNVSASATTATEIGYVNGVTSAIQTQINAKKTIATGNNYKWETTGATGDLQETTVTASRAVVSDANGLPAASTTTASEVLKLNGIPATSYITCMEAVTFTQTSGNGTYTGTIALPAGSYLLDVQVHGIVLWDASTSASLVVGDGGDADGFFLATDLNATDLLAGEVNNIEHPGGLAGVYIAGEQRVLYSASARNIIGVVTQVGTGTAGRTHLVVHYAVPTAVAAVKV